MRRRLLLSYVTLTLVVLLLLEIPLGLVYANEQRRRLTASVERDALALSIRAEEGLEDGDVARRSGRSCRALPGAHRRAGDRGPARRHGARRLATPARRRRRDYLSRPEIRAALHRSRGEGHRGRRSLGTTSSTSPCRS